MSINRTNAFIVLDSLNAVSRDRVTTWELTYWRAIHAEVLTHGMLKSNSASSRAIPFNRMVQMVMEDPFIPIKFMKDHKGMQGSDFMEDPKAIAIRTKQWLDGRDAAVKSAIALHTPLSELYKKNPEIEESIIWEDDEPVTKQVCNRMLEAYMWHTAVLTGTEFANFFAMRAHPMAEIHFQDLATKMLEAYNLSTPQVLKAGEWHVPYGHRIFDMKVHALVRAKYPETILSQPAYAEEFWAFKVKIATAIQAGVSYLRHNNETLDLHDLLDLHDSLVKRPHQSNFNRGSRGIGDPIHASPAFHCCKAMSEEEYHTYVKGKALEVVDAGDTLKLTMPKNNSQDFGWCGHLKGFRSYRSMIPNENITKDSRIIKK